MQEVDWKNTLMVSVLAGGCNANGYFGAKYAHWNSHTTYKIWHNGVVVKGITTVEGGSHSH